VAHAETLVVIYFYLSITIGFRYLHIVSFHFSECSVKHCGFEFLFIVVSILNAVIIRNNHQIVPERLMSVTILLSQKMEKNKNV